MDFSKLDRLIKNIDVFGIPTCDCAVTYNREVVYRGSFGYADAENTRPVSEEDVYYMYSATKVLTAVAAMQLVEQGKLSLQDPVKKFYPHYGRFVRSGDGIVPCQREATVEHLLSMQGGVTYNTDTPHMQAFLKDNPTPTTQEFLTAFCEEPLWFEPGTHFQYSMCLDIVGGIIEQVSGERYSDYIRDHIANPLGWKVCAYHLTEELKPHMVQLYARNENAQRTPRTEYLSPENIANRYIFGDNYDSAGAGLITRVSDYMLLSDALANDGVGKNGARILTRASIDEMRRNRLDTRMKFNEHALVMSDYGYGYGLAVRTMVDNRLSESPVGEFGWDGAAGAFMLSDPDNHISLTYGMHILHLNNVKQSVHNKLRDYTYEALREEIGPKQ